VPNVPYGTLRACSDDDRRVVGPPVYLSDRLQVLKHGGERHGGSDRDCKH